MGTKASQEALPGMEQRDIPEIEEAADNYRRIRDERCALSQRESEAKAALIQVMKNKGRSFYSYRGLRVQLELTDNVKVKATDDDDEPVGNFRQSRRQQKVEEAMDETVENLREEDEEIEQQEPVSEEERQRLHTEAVARWQRHRPASSNEEEGEGFHPGFPPGFDAERASSGLGQEDDGGGTPFPTEYSQEEISRMAGFYCAQKISEEKPVKICYVNNEPHIITGGASKGQRWLYVEAWSILPIENVGEENAKTYTEVNAQYREQFDDPEHEYKPMGYEGMKINCGSKKKPKWWVIVGPRQRFTAPAALAAADDEYAAVAPDDGPAAADDFTAPRCDECGRIDNGHTKDCSKNPDRLTKDDYLAYAEFRFKTNHESHARKMAVTGLMDDEIRAWKQQQAGNGNGASAEQASSELDPEIPSSSQRAALTLVEQAIDR